MHLYSLSKIWQQQKKNQTNDSFFRRFESYRTGMMKRLNDSSPLRTSPRVIFTFVVSTLILLQVNNWVLSSIFHNIKDKRHKLSIWSFVGQIILNLNFKLFQLSITLCLLYQPLRQYAVVALNDLNSTALFDGDLILQVTDGKECYDKGCILILFIIYI